MHSSLLYILRNILLKRRIRFDNLKHDVNAKCKELLVQEYFGRIRSRDIQGLLNLFSDDSVIHEPFSKSSPLSGKSEIESFLRSVVMANEGMQYEIRIERDAMPKNSLVAIVIFHKDEALKGKFTFEFNDTNGSNLNERIMALRIEFID